MPSWHVRQLGICNTFHGHISWDIVLPYRLSLRGMRLMMTSSNGNIFRVTGPLCGEFTGPGEFPPQRPVTRSFDVFFHLRLNKRLSKQPRGWWFETPLWSLWRHCNAWVRRWHAMSIPRPHSRPKRIHTRTHFREKKGYFFKGRPEFAKPRKGGTGSFFYIRCSCKLSTHSGVWGLYTTE